mgnify:CR=1 FL=1
MRFTYGVLLGFMLHYSIEGVLDGKPLSWFIYPVVYIIMLMALVAYRKDQ